MTFPPVGKAFYPIRNQLSKWISQFAKRENFSKYKINKLQRGKCSVRYLVPIYALFFFIRKLTPSLGLLVHFLIRQQWSNLYILIQGSPLFFQEGVMIVDSPGVGESDVMSEIVMNYLPRAFCFMYVINSYNAGGIQDDRVRGWKREFLIRISRISSATVKRHANATKESRDDAGVKAHAGWVWVECGLSFS